MRVLIISTNPLPASPSGPAYVAGAVRQAGHEVQVYERLFAPADPVAREAELAAVLDTFQPQVVGVSIRLVFGDSLDATAPLGTRHTDLKPGVRELVTVVRRHSDALIVLGGPGFNYFAREWLGYLDLQYGIRGEGEEALPLFLHRLEHGGDLSAVPGCVMRTGQGLQSTPPKCVEQLDAQALPAYDLFDLDRYGVYQVAPAVFTKRGCAFGCTYCPYSKLEGKRYRLKSPARVLAEFRHINRGGGQQGGIRRVAMCDNNFNAPRTHAEALCRALAADPAGYTWSTGDLRPAGVNPGLCQLMVDAGCVYANLAVESASAVMLKRLGRGYTPGQVREALTALSRSSLPFGASLMIGAPGETPETIAATLAVLDEFEIPSGVWVTIGVYLWTELQDITAEARRAGLLRDPGQLFAGCVYLSPALSPVYLLELMDALRARPGYQVQFNKPHAEWQLAQPA